MALDEQMAKAFLNSDEAARLIDKKLSSGNYFKMQNQHQLKILFQLLKMRIKDNVLFTFTTFKASLFVNATNKPLVGGKLYTYLAETTTPATTYSNDTGTPNTNPIILDTNGECNLYLDDDKVYRLILKDANDVTYFDKDRVSSIGGGDYKVLTFDTIADLKLKNW